MPPETVPPTEPGPPTTTAAQQLREEMTALAHDAYTRGGRDALTAMMRALSEAGQVIAANLLKDVLDERFGGPTP